MHPYQKIISLFIISLYLAIPQANSQNARNSIYAEFGGNGAFYSLNYEMRFNNQNDGLGGRAGFGFLPTGTGSILSMPLMVNYLKGKNSNYLELGLGVTYLSVDDLLGFLETDVSTWLSTATIGYRRQALDGGFLFKVGVTPFYNEGGVHFWSGLGVGYAF
jgi:hypothetical protein